MADFGYKGKGFGTLAAHPGKKVLSEITWERCKTSVKSNYSGNLLIRSPLVYENWAVHFNWVATDSRGRSKLHNIFTDISQ